jgi:sugar phosphate isomerase/epimerase
MHRRKALKLLAGGCATAMGASAARCAEANKRTSLGIVIYALGLAQRIEKQGDPKADLFDPNRFLEYCRALGAGGVQVPLGVQDDAYCKGLRAKAERWGMFIEATLSVPRDRGGQERFEAEVRTAVRCGVSVARTVIVPGRRYEEFATVEKFRESLERGRKALELAEPIAARHRLRLAVENHKDHRAADLVQTLKRLSSPWVGACVDVGNNLALLEDPVELVKTLAPFAMSVHLKDQAVQEYADGFLLADAALGQGCLDLPTIVEVLRKANPRVCFGLETITRDPLKVPCLTEAYWTSMGELPAADLARTLRTVRTRAARQLPRVSGRPLAEQAQAEAANVAASLAYSRDRLGL